MKYPKMLALASVMAMALMAMAATASATTLEVKSVPQTKSVKVEATLEKGTSFVFQKTEGSFANTCTGSALIGATEEGKTTGTTVSGPLTTVTVKPCTNEEVKVDAAGSLSVEWKEIVHPSGSKTLTDGTLRWSNLKLTVPSPFGPLTCVTGSGVDIGTLTGKASGQATMDIHAVMDCGFLAPSATWTASYVVTSPEGLGVVK